MKTALVILGGLLTLIVLGVGVSLLAVRFADGPKGPIPGGELTSGDFFDATAVDWAEVLGDRPVAEIELQLMDPVSSRTTGAFAYDGQIYVPCDLGFVWRRLPTGIARSLLHTIWIFKDWHQNADVDGRVVVRVQGKRYKLNAVRVTDQALMSKFRKHVSTAAEGAFELLDVKTDPNDIWFFRLDPRSNQ